MPINNLADFAKMKYRVPKNVVMVDTYKAFGSDPVPIAWSEALTATQTGTVDGGDLPIDVMYSQKLYHKTSTTLFYSREGGKKCCTFRDNSRLILFFPKQILEKIFQVNFHTPCMPSNSTSKYVCRRESYSYK